MHFFSLNVVNFFAMQHGVTETGGVGNPVSWETDLLLLTYWLFFFF